MVGRFAFIFSIRGLYFLNGCNVPEGFSPSAAREDIGTRAALKVTTGTSRDTAQKAGGQSLVPQTCSEHLWKEEEVSHSFLFRTTVPTGSSTAKTHVVPIPPASLILEY